MTEPEKEIPTCQFCEAQFNTRSGLFQHQRTVVSCVLKQEKLGIIVKHKKDFSCDGCKKKFTTKASLVYHLEICKEKVIKMKDEKIKHLENCKTNKKEPSEHIMLPIRKDGMVNATSLCKTNNKNISHYFEDETTKKFINDLGTTWDILIKVELGIYWVHQKIGYHLVQWVLRDETKEHYKDNDVKIKELQQEIEFLKYKVEHLEPLPVVDIPITNVVTEYRIEPENDGPNSISFSVARNKIIKNFLELQTTKAYIKALISNTGIPFSRIIETWVYRKLGYYLAQWISSEFTLGKKTSFKALDSMYQENNSLKQDYQKLLVKHNSSLKSHRYVKFKERGPCFYIIENGIPCECKHNVGRKKFGIAGLSKDNEEDTFDNRLKSHRTLWPQLKVNFIIFMKDVEFLEKTIKRFYDKEINPNGHEIIEGVTTEQIVVRIHKWIDDMSITEYTIASYEHIKEYNDYVVTTVKVK